MAYKTPTELKARFEGGDVPTQQDFADLIESTHAEIISIKSKGAIGNGDSDDASTNTTAIQAALDEAGMTVPDNRGAVYVPPGKFFTGPLQIPAGVTLFGAGDCSELTLESNASGNLLSTKVPSTDDRISIRHLTLNGNSANQSSARDIINLDATGMATGTNVRHFYHDLYIVNASGTGLVHTFPGRGSIASDIVINNCDVYGLEVAGSDSKFANIDAAQSGEDGVFVSGAGNQFTAIKSWFSGRIAASSGNGFNIRNGGDSRFSNCYSQDNEQHGWSLFGQSGVLEGIVMSGCVSDSDNKSLSGFHGINLSNVEKARIDIKVYVGNTGNPGVPSDGIAISNGTTGCLITCMVDDQSSFKVDGTAADVGNNHIILGDREGRVTSITYASSITPDFLASEAIDITLTGNITINATSRMYEGFKLKFIFRQDATGGRTVTFNSQYKANWTPSTTANEINVITFQADGTNWIQESAVTGLS